MLVLHLAMHESYPLPALQALTELSPPRAVRSKDTRGRIPLHYISESTQVEAVQHLVQVWGDSVHQADNDGFLPVHRAIGNPAVLELLIGRAPDTVRVRSADGSLPLHLALMNTHLNPQEIHLLVAAWPESLRERSASGFLAIHMALQTRPRSALRSFGFPLPNTLRATVRFLLGQFPASIMEPTTREGYLPLHVACMAGCYGTYSDPEQPDLADAVELEFFRYLVELAIAAVGVASHEQLFPANYAVSLGFLSLDTTQYLFEQFPAAIRQRDARGRNALHMSLDRDKPRSTIVQYLSEVRPQMLRETDRDGATPLYLAVARHDAVALPIVTVLVDQGPEALEQADVHGRLPVHAAVARREPSMPIAALLIERSPRTLLVADSQGMLPLHAALAQGSSCPLDLVKLLVAACPESIKNKDVDGNLPLFVAASNDASLDVLFLLATHFPEAMHGKRVTGPHEAAAEPPPTVARPQKRLKSCRH